MWDPPLIPGASYLFCIYIDQWEHIPEVREFSCAITYTHLLSQQTYAAAYTYIFIYLFIYLYITFLLRSLLDTALLITHKKQETRSFLSHIQYIFLY